MLYLLACAKKGIAMMYLLLMLQLMCSSVKPLNIELAICLFYQLTIEAPGYVIVYHHYKPTCSPCYMYMCLTVVACMYVCMYVCMNV